MAQTDILEVEWFTCPAEGCGRRYGTINGVIMHAVNKPDEMHAEFRGRNEAIRSLLMMYREGDA